MGGVKSPIGTLIRGVECGLAAPFDRKAFDRIHAQESLGGKMSVSGVGLVYGVVGWVGWWGALRFEPGSLEAPKKNRKYRDMMGLYAHDIAAILCRSGNNTLDVTFGEEAVSYEMRLNAADGLARDVKARLMREDVNASSVGAVPLAGEWVKGYDTSLDADPETAGTEIDIFSITRAEMFEVSLVAQGAFAGATSAPTSSAPGPAEAEAEVIRIPEIKPELPVVDAEVSGIAAASSGNVGNVEADGETASTSETEQGLPDGEPESGAGGEPGGGEEAARGAAEPDDGGEPPGETAAAVAERQGLTVKEMLRSMRRYGIDIKQVEREVA